MSARDSAFNVPLDITNDEVGRALFLRFRLFAPPHLLDAPTRRGMEGQQRLLSHVVATVCAAARVATPAAMSDAHRVVAPGWWFEISAMGVTTPVGAVSLVACGVDGAALLYINGTGVDHCSQGISSAAWAIVALHEAAHAAHHRFMGLGKAGVSLTSDREPGEEPAGFKQFVRGLHRQITGALLPAAYDATRWPLEAPGMVERVERIAAAVAPFAVPQAPRERPCSDTEWLSIQAEAFAQDIRELIAMRNAVAAFSAAQPGAV